MGKPLVPTSEYLTFQQVPTHEEVEFHKSDVMRNATGAA